jgi:DNA-binding protein H-NS
MTFSHSFSRTSSNRREAAIAEIQKLIRVHSLTREELVRLEPKRGSSPWERQRRIAFEHCRQMVDFWDIAASELRSRKGAVLDTHQKSKAIPTVQIKYRHPVNGATWDGQGSQPDWLKQALLKEGYTVRELKNEHYVDHSAEHATEVTTEHTAEHATEHAMKDQRKSSTTWA